MNILGISAFYHDSAACLVQDGEITAAAQEERFTRKKHDYHFPENSIRYCLGEGGIGSGDIDLVAFYDKPLLKFERILESYLYYAPRGVASFLKAMPLWLNQKLWIPDLIRKNLDGYGGEIIFPEHHESHAASAFYPSPFKKAAIQTMDGVGEWATTSYGIGSGTEVRILKEIHFPHSLGLLYSAFTYYTGFKVNSGEYKIMGLAPYGEPKYVQTILNELVDLKEDGSFRLNMKYFNFAVGLTMTNRHFDRLFGGPPRKPETPVTQKEMNLARSIQDVAEEIMVRIARTVAEDTGEKNLCLAGGVALNCVGNGRILREGIFDRIWIQPAAGDAGAALGAALLGWYRFMGNPRDPDESRDSQKGSYLGPGFSDSDIQAFLIEIEAPSEKLVNGQLPDRVAHLIANGMVVGWFQGRMEFGPRALGSRSIIGDARSDKMQSIMNLKIKNRESFRPFAPSALRERTSDYFQIDVESPYMLFVAPVTKDIRTASEEDMIDLFGIEKLKIKRSEIPAVTHVDFSARVQTVDGKFNRLFYELIKAFEKQTGCPVVINTSFNVRGEPIVCTPEEAYRCFMRTEMDYLVLGAYLLMKSEQPEWNKDKDRRNELELD